MSKSKLEKAAHKPSAGRKPAENVAAKAAQPPALAALQRAVDQPQAAQPVAMLRLQRQYGNRAVSGLIQAKLTVGAAGDQYEQAADTAAQRVMSAPAAAAGAAAAPSTTGAGGAAPAQPAAAAVAPGAQPNPEDLQPSAIPNRPAGPGSFEAGAEFEGRLAQQQGGGHALPGPTQQFMESRLGADFSGVRVHTGGEAAQLNRSVQAQAFTHGSDIYFGEGHYAPASSAGQRLLAHELTHVVQQTGAAAPAKRAARKPAAKPAAGQVARRIQRRTKFKQLLDIGPDYDNELAVQRPNLVGVVTGTAKGIKALYEGRAALQAIADPLDAPAITAAKALLATDAPTCFGRITPMSLPDALADVTLTYNTILEKAQLQDFPVNPLGVVDQVALNARMVEYDTITAATPDAQENTKVDITGGVLRRNNPTHDLVDTTNSVTHTSGKGTEIFVVSPSGVLHMASHKVGKYHHSSLLAGSAVALGGELVVHAGAIIAMTNKSGHYSPSPASFRQYLHMMQKKGVALNFRIWGYGALPAEASGITAAAWLATLPERETYEFESTATVYESYYQDHGQAVPDYLTVTLGWKTNPAKTGMLDSANAPLTQKQVRQALKAHFGPAKAKVAKKHDAATTTIRWM